MKKEPKGHAAHAAYMASVIIEEPQMYEEAIEDSNAEKWRTAMNEEYKSLMDNETWDLVLPPPNRQVIGSKWIYKIKQKADGNVERYKARFVVKGYSQNEGVDYDQTFSPVFKMTSLRTILAIRAALDLEIYQMDVKTAFLNDKMDTDVYIEQPKGYELYNNGR